VIVLFLIVCFSFLFFSHVAIEDIEAVLAIGFDQNGSLLFPFRGQTLDVSGELLDLLL